MGKRTPPRRGARPPAPRPPVVTVVPAPPVTAAPAPVVDANEPPLRGNPPPPPRREPLPRAHVSSPIAGGGFWAGFEIPWAKLVGFRFVFFALLAVDAYLQLSHAPRYGAGGFNVQHVPGLLPEAGRGLMTFLHAVLCLGFALIAQGALVRVLLPIATALYGYTYFVSQLDSYQHHYLVWLLLVLLCFVPTAPDPAPARAAAGVPPAVRSWALRLVLVQLGLVYGYAAISKMDPLWLDGTTLARQVKPGSIHDLLAAVGWSPVAMSVIAGELFLVAAVWWRKLWPFALVVGVGLHLGIELVGLEIGLFSYLMFALYLLVVPDRVYAPVHRLGAAIAAQVRRLPVVVRGAAAGGVAIAAFLAVATRPVFVSPELTGTLVAGLFVGLVVAVIIAGIRRDGRAAMRSCLIVGLAATVPAIAARASDVAADYHRYWGGAARRLGDDASARQAYRGLLEVDPSSEYAHYYLGELDLKVGQPDRALAHYQAAQRSQPERARGFLGEAVVQLQRGNKAAAQAALETALRLEPRNADARKLYATLNTDVPAEAMPAPAAAPLLDDDDR